MQNHLHFQGNDMIISSEELSEELLNDLLDCANPGPADDAIDYVRNKYKITGNTVDCKNYLKGCGAWDDDELSDHNLNLDRLVWLTGCDLKEKNEAYFSTY
jgi:hypothetical protein